MLTDINSLTPDELKSFSEFINSPYFNKSGAMKKLYCYLEGKYPDVSKEDVTKEKISRYLFDDLIVNDVRMRKIESEFNKLFEKFLIHHEVNFNKVESQISLLMILRRKFLYRTYKKKLDEIEKYSEEDFGLFGSFYLNKTNYYHELKIYSNTGLIESTSEKEITNNILYFIFQGLHFNLNRNDVPLPLGSMIQSIYEFIEKNKKYFYKNHPDIVVLYYVNLQSGPNGDIYLDKVEKYYKKYKNNFSSELKNYYFQILLNILHLKRSINPTKENFLKAFEFLQRLLRDGQLKMFFEEGRIMNQAQYFSCFNIAINVQSFDRAEKFATEYNKYLPHESKNKMMNIARLILNFFRKDFTDVLKRLNEVSKDNAKHYVYTRYIKLMVLFELDDFQTLHYEIQAISKHLQRLKKTKTLPDREIIRGNYFVNLMIFITGVKEGRVRINSKKFTELKSRINSETYVPEYQFWFIEKVKEMESGVVKKSKS